MTTLKDIEALTTEYAERREILTNIVADLQNRLSEVRRRMTPALRDALRACTDSHDHLRAALNAAPELFEKRKTLTIRGVRVGYMKQKGTVVIEDEAAVIARIRKLLPEEQAELLVRVRESVHKPAVYDLTTSDLKRLGITVTDSEDVPFIKPVDGEVDKLVSALLAEAEKVEDAA